MKRRRAPEDTAMKRRRALRLTLALVAAIPWLAAPGTGRAPMVDVVLGGERIRVPVAELASRVPLAEGKDFRVAEIGRDAATSHHVVAIRTAETPHRHDRHDLFVVMVRGHGTWRVGDETLDVGEQSILSIPRGTVHAFGNLSDGVAIAYAVYTPPFDGVDRVEVEARPDEP
jgi:mannose-6-phosphate isomerase-like protein (cupin superfamily)